MIKKNTGSYIFIQKKSHEKQQKTTKNNKKHD